ncbi:hypothetical protein TNCV_196301 [Trichonephila clavipes]|uniref:Uncharacterized protein n=1 Tax=Trichonephila clavipes TaxID=2585209 RepID=A0A8X6WI49_TRICX|nr:hypothetical protein TNCV_196301 [Trichonephila clavipes]
MDNNTCLFWGIHGPNFIFMDDNSHTGITWRTNTSNRRIFNDWSGLRCPLTLIPPNTYEMPLDAQLQLQWPSMRSRVPWCKSRG